MSAYHFTNTFELAADADRVFATIADTGDWATWWAGLRSQVLTPGASGASAPTGRVQRFRVRAPLGYPIEVIGEFLPPDGPRSLPARMRGHLDGEGAIVVRPAGHHRATVGYRLSVRLTSPWMRLADPVARPLFAWCHRRVVLDALDGLVRKLGLEPADGDDG